MPIDQDRPRGTGGPPGNSDIVESRVPLDLYKLEMERDLQKDQREHELRIQELSANRTDRLFQLIYFLAGIGALLFILYYFQPRDPALLNTILQILLGFVGGFGAGYGIKSWRQGP